MLGSWRRPCGSPMLLLAFPARGRSGCPLGRRSPGAAPVATGLAMGASRAVRRASPRGRWRCGGAGSSGDGGRRRRLIALREGGPPLPGLGAAWRSTASRALGCGAALRLARPASPRLVGPSAQALRGWDVAALQFLLAWARVPVRLLSTAGRSARHGVAAALPGLGRPRGRRARRPQLRWPLSGVLPRRWSLCSWLPWAGAPTHGFGPRGGAFHSGPRPHRSPQAPPAAAGRGGASSVGWDPAATEPRRHLPPLGHESWYAHLSRIDLLCRVRASSPAGSSGGLAPTGNATGPHLHFELRLRGAPLDPLTGL